MKHLTEELALSQEQNIKELNRKMSTHDKEIDRIITVLMRRLPGADLDLLNLRVDRDIE